LGVQVFDWTAMKIERRKDGRASADQLREELARILRSDSDGVPVCAPDCPGAGPERCSRRCPDIPVIMSSDPVRHPLEGRIAPLVYELKRLETFHPCWSCEGHNDADGKLWKIPRVWFYCESVVQLRVLADAVKELHLAEKLSVPWRVALTFSNEDNADTTFSLEPDLDHERPLLPALQRDIDTIADHLRELAFAEARKLSRMAR
jgi:hypothetical protein